jgi:hypothetical protein
MLKKSILLSACSLITLAAASAFAHQVPSPNAHAPIGVMGDHLHKQGDWMLSYKYELTNVSGFKNGRDTIPTSTVLSQYGEAAAKMQMQMHMFEFMYGITDNLNLMVMPQYMQMDMTHQSSHGGGHSHTHTLYGLGDTEVTGLYSFYKSNNNRVENEAHLNFGVSLPTGSIDKTFTDHHNNVYHMPYNMQFGSGTVDPILGATYTMHTENWQFGGQTLNYLRFGKNDNGYRQGNKYTATGWASRNLTSFASLSFRLDGEAWENVEGRDITLPLTIIAGANPDLRAGERVMANIGLNLLGGHESGILAGHRLAVEFGMPVYERYSGPQSQNDYRLTAGWQKSF